GWTVVVEVGAAVVTVVAGGSVVGVFSPPGIQATASNAVASSQISRDGRRFMRSPRHQVDDLFGGGFGWDLHDDVGDDATAGHRRPRRCHPSGDRHPQLAVVPERKAYLNGVLTERGLAHDRRPSPLLEDPGQGP